MTVAAQILPVPLDHADESNCCAIFAIGADRLNTDGKATVVQADGHGCSRQSGQGGDTRPYRLSCVRDCLSIDQNLAFSYISVIMWKRDCLHNGADHKVSVPRNAAAICRQCTRARSILCWCFSCYSGKALFFPLSGAFSRRRASTR